MWWSYMCGIYYIGLHDQDHRVGRGGLSAGPVAGVGLISFDAVGGCRIFH